METPVIDSTVAARHGAEVETGARFAFGENWRAFLSTVDEARIAEAMRSLQAMLRVESLAGRRFLDIGSGSGLFSLAAHRLGADVTSFDYDPASVGCTLELRRRYAGDGTRWRVLHGSVLDVAFLESLGTHDVVYSWGVLHHTGALWTAIRNTLPLVRDEGALFLAIYNDQGAWSRRWDRIKRAYRSGPTGRVVVGGVVIAYWALRTVLADVVRLRAPWHSMATYKRNRGMSIRHDWLDWLGGWPCEVAKPEEIILGIQPHGFAITNLRTQYGTMGCVEYVFRRVPR